MKNLYHFFSANFFAVIILFNLIVFGQSLTHELVWDDHAFIENQNHQQLAGFRQIIGGDYPMEGTGVYRPVRNLLYAVTIPTLKANPVYHHGLVLLLHIICSLQVYTLLKRLTNHLLSAQLGSLLFSLHPIHSESIYWITAGYDLLFVALALGAINAHCRYKSQETQNLWPAYLMTALAIFSNEIALILPLLFILIDRLQYKSSPPRFWANPPISLYLFTAAFYWLVRLIYLPSLSLPDYAFPIFHRIFFFSWFLLGQYILTLFLPYQLGIDRLFVPGLTGLYGQNHNLNLPPPIFSLSDPKVILPLLIGILWIGLVFYNFYKKTRYRLPLIWIPLTLLPVLQIIPIAVLYSERYAYLASIGFVLLIAQLLKQLILKNHYQTLVVGLVILYLAYFGLVSARRGPDWQNDTTLWTKTISQNPESAAAANSLGVVSYIEGDLNQSLAFHRRSVELNPFVTTYQQNYISALSKLKQYDEIIAFIQLLLATDPTNINLYTLLASTYDAKGEYAGAMQNYQKAYDYAPIGGRARLEIEKLVEVLDRKY